MGKRLIDYLPLGGLRETLEENDEWTFAGFHCWLCYTGEPHREHEIIEILHMARDPEILRRRTVEV